MQTIEIKQSDACIDLSDRMEEMKYKVKNVLKGIADIFCTDMYSCPGYFHLIFLFSTSQKIACSFKNIYLFLTSVIRVQ